MYKMVYNYFSCREVLAIAGFIIKFSKKLEPLLDWCKFNKLDLYWSKTYFMLITSLRVKLPIEILVPGLIVKVVDTFKLLRITID